MFLVNFKTYSESTGNNSLELLRDMEDIASEFDTKLIACPQAVDLRDVVEKSDKVKVWSQHVDPPKRGRATGWLTPELVKECGAQGSLLNHSEHKLSVGVLGETVARCREVGLKVLIFADSVEEAKMAAQFKPDYVSYEPPELVGSKDSSVAKAKPEIIKNIVEAVPDIPIIVGAGVKDVEDVRVSLKLGAK
jgi:triosephosphate isomerase